MHQNTRLGRAVVLAPDVMVSMISEPLPDEVMKKMASWTIPNRNIA